MNVSKTSKPFILTLIGIALIGIPLSLYALQQQQVFRQFAFSTQQAAVSECSTEDGSVDIKITFANTESVKDVTVTANDLQTGTFVDLGTVKHQESKSANIVTLRSSISSGSVIFKIASADGSTGTTQAAAQYNAINNCPGSSPGTNYCPDTGQNSQGLCTWDSVPGAQGYTVVVNELDNESVVQSVSVPKDATQSAFPMSPGKAYTCTVTPTNECSTGTPATSPAKVCPVTPSPSQVITPTPTPPVCPNGTSQLGTCTWDAISGATSYTISVKDLTSGIVIKNGTVQAPSTEFTFPDITTDTYQCSVSATNVCGQNTPTQSPPSTCTVPTPTVTTTPAPSLTPTPKPSVTPTMTPTPTPKLSPTPTPKPSPTPTVTPTPIPTSTPFPTPTPVVIVRTITQPPQQTVIQQPPQQTVVRVPGQTQTIVQQGQTTVVQQPAPTQPPFSTPTPTMAATGDTVPTFTLVGASAILLIAGGLLFFIL